MALVNYASSSSSSSSEPEDDLNSHNQHCVETRTAPLNPSTPLPPLPPAFHNLYAAAARVSTSDDPALHHGRKRAVPHVQGNWPTHVYLEWLPSSGDSQALTALIDAVASTASLGNKLFSLMTSDLSTAQPLHISLSAPLSLTTPQHDALLPALQPVLAAAGVNAFTVGLAAPRWVSNHDGSRWFLVVGIVKPAGDELNRLLKVCNGVARQFGVPELYGGGSGRMDCSDAFHFSVAWTLAVEGGDAGLRKIDEAVVEAVQRIRVRFANVKVKVGNVVTAVPLGERSVGKGQHWFLE